MKDNGQQGKRPKRFSSAITEALIAKVFERAIPEPNTGCLLWEGTATPHGYGLLGSGGRTGKTLYTHRIAFASKHGSCEGIHVLHRCDTPSCCNPDHLFAGDPRSNTEDMLSKGRQAKGELIHTAKLDAERVVAIRLDPRSLSKIAADYGVDIKQIHRVKRRETWKHVA